MAIESVNVAESAVSSVQKKIPQQADQTQQQVQQAQKAEQAQNVSDQEVRAKEALQETEDVSAADLQAAIDRLNELMKDGQRSLAFSVDDELGEVVVKVMDTKTEQLIRQIPNEESLKFAKNLEGVLGVIFNDRA